MADESIERAFPAMLKERGRVNYSGSRAVISMGGATAQENQREVTAVRIGSVVHAVNLKMPVTATARWCSRPPDGIPEGAFRQPQA